MCVMYKNEGQAIPYNFFEKVDGVKLWSRMCDDVMIKQYSALEKYA